MLSKKSLGLFVPLAFGFLVLGCKTPELEAPTPSAPEPAVESEVPDAFLTEWAGSTWIIRDHPDKRPRTFPGYRGFHLAQDGRLLLINLDSAVGDSWSADANRLRMGLLDGVPDIPIEGFYLAYEPDGTDENDDGKVRMRLVNEVFPDSEGLVFEKASVNIDIVENHWIPKRLDGGEQVMWPMNREIHLMLLPDAVGGLGVLGYGGENRFRGAMVLGEDNFVVEPLAMTRRVGPASEFENLFVERISETTRYVQVDDDLYLYNETRPTAAFRVRLFD